MTYKGEDFPEAFILLRWVFPPGGKDSELPRGTRVGTGTTAPLAQIINGSTAVTNGTQNFLAALKVCMGMVGARTIREFQQAELVLAPAIKTEGKHLQLNS